MTVRASGSAESFCLGKHRFDSPGMAKDVIRGRNESRRGKKKAPMKGHVYRCPKCNGFHIGSSRGE